MIIGICGWISGGKNTVAEFLVTQHGFKQESFAHSLKLAVSNVFGWPMEMLEGNSKLAREQRDQIDKWWANRLGIPHLTPRWVLQQWGTDICRVGFHDDIWIASMENRLRSNDNNIVISDCRFPNEIAAIKAQGGQIVWVRRGELPDWYEAAGIVNQGPEFNDSWQQYKTLLDSYNIHYSETAWVGTTFDAVIDNNGTIDQLYEAITKNLKL